MRTSFIFLLFFLNGTCTSFHQEKIEKIFVFQKVPACIVVDNNLNDEWNEAILFAVQEWNSKTQIELFVFCDFEKEEQYSDIVLISFLRDENQSSIFAKTYFREQKPKILIIINSLFDYIEQDIKNQIMTHELGHSLGFFHEKDKTSIMYPDIPVDWIKDIKILPHHIEILQQVYKFSIY